MKKFIIIIISVLSSMLLSAQIIINQEGSIDQWVRDVLIGPGIIVSNITYTGASVSIATFTTGAKPTSLNMPSGIMLCTGKAKHVALAAYTEASSVTSGGSNHILADIVYPTKVQDAIVLEFDFIPVSDTVSFKYIFGSEEYPDFANSTYNDIFGFFISGMDPSSPGSFYVNKNIALIPGTNKEVSINNINHGTGVDADTICENCDLYFDNYESAQIVYNAFTVPLKATFSVYPCTNYHIKMIIADVGDASLDSGVFFESNSFSAPTINLSYVASNNADTIAIENCNEAIVTLTIPDVQLVDKTYFFTVSGTAEEGVDYETIQHNLVIPAGRESASITITPIVDNVIEGLEFIELVVKGNDCTTDTLIVYIQDYTYMGFQLPEDTLLCNNDSTTIFPIITNGYRPYSYLWSSGETDSALLVYPNMSTMYTLTVTDICNHDSIDQIIIYASDPEVAFLGDSACMNDSVFLKSIAPPLYTHLWSTGDTTTDISFPILKSNYYSVLITDTFGCTELDSTYVEAFVLPNATTSPDTTICKNVVLKIRGGGDFDSYKWSTGDITKDIEVTPIITTRYELLIKDSNGCYDTTSVIIGVIDVPKAEIFCDIDTLCLGKFVELRASNADAYLWNTGEISQNITVSPTIENVFILTIIDIKDGSACEDIDSLSLVVENCNKVYLPNAFSPNGDGLNDYFGVQGEFSEIDKFSMLIYSRNGQLILSTTNIEQMWDGKFNGKFVTSGVYTYVISVSELLREPYILKGTIHLLR